MNETDRHAASSGQLGFGFDDAVPTALAASPPKIRKAKAPPPAPLALEPEAMARVLEGHPDYRVLRRLPVRQRFTHQPEGPVTRVLILDTETTGL